MQSVKAFRYCIALCFLRHKNYDTKRVLAINSTSYEINKNGGPLSVSPEA